MQRDLKSILDLSTVDVHKILNLTQTLKNKPLSKNKFLQGKSVGLVFEKPSNRTRVSFEVGVYHFGGKCIYLSPGEINLGVRESVADVAKTLSRYLDLIVARTFSQETIEELSVHADIPIINGLSDLYHPCQGLTDLFTIQEKFEDLANVNITYVGDGNNVTHSLLIAASKVGANVTVATPQGFEVNEEILQQVQKEAEKTGSVIKTTHDPKEAVTGADVVYTDTWISMGQEEEAKEKLAKFEGFRVNRSLCAHAKENFVFMHCLPAHRDQEVCKNTIDGEHSIVFDQAENRLHTQKAIMLFLLDN